MALTHALRAAEAPAPSAARLGAGQEFLLILFFVWVVLAAYSFLKKPICVLGHEIEQSEIAQLLSSRARIQIDLQPSLAEAGPVLAQTASEPRESAPARAVDDTPQRILILGDSMIEGLLPRLADYAKENGHTVNAVIWYGSRTIDWARGTRLSDAINAHRPTFVIVVAGSSELFVRGVEKRSLAIEQMLKTVGSRKLVWVGPPNWTTDTGINATIERTVGTDRFFRSADLTFERKRDGIHPTLSSSEHWLDLVTGWIVSRSSVPILLNRPSKTGTPRPNVRVFAPPTS